MARMSPKLEKRLTRQRRVRRKVSGSGARPRLAVFRSNKHIYAQVVDDETRKTLAAASTLSPGVREGLEGKDKKEAAKLVGAAVAALCKQREIERVVFDRGGFRYHGRVRALAEGAREAGLIF